MKPSISIIVPVYNVEPYLDECLNSILNQSMKPSEIILVDDGSTDRSGEICDKYLAYSNHVIVIHKQNGGLSDARNVGLQAAKSDYVLFLDSDDTIALNTIEKFHSFICKKKADIVVGNVISFRPDQKVLKMHSARNGELVSGQEFIKMELRLGTMFYEAVQALYSKNFLTVNNLWFIKGLLHEDQVFTTKAFLYAQTVIPTDILFYNHLIREGSISTQIDQRPNARSIIEICSIMEKEVAFIKDSKLKKMVLDHCVDLYYKIFVDADLIQYPEIRINTKYLKNHSFSIKNKVRTMLYCLNERILFRMERSRRY